METSRAGAKLDVGFLRFARDSLGAVPDAGPTVDALLAVELWPTVTARRDRLSGADFHADPRPTAFAEIGIEEDYVVGVAWRGLDLATDEQRILMRNKEFAVELDRRPTRAFHERLVYRGAAREALPAKASNFLRRNAIFIVFLKGNQMLTGR